MLSLRRCMNHILSSTHTDLSTSPLGEWCLRSLRSSSRELRIAAATTLQSFLAAKPGMINTFLHKNRMSALDSLQSLWTKNEVPAQEGCVLALSAMTEYASDEELDVILSRLVDYLGTSNPYINELVYTELQKLGQAVKGGIAAVLRPYWRTLAVVVIRSIQTRPIVAQHLCELLGMDTKGLLMFIEPHAIPQLVLAGEKEIIGRIAKAHGHSTTVFELCTKKSTIAHILALLLSQSFAEPEQTIMAMLIDISSEFKVHDLGSWVKHRGIPSRF